MTALMAALMAALTTGLMTGALMAVVPAAALAAPPTAAAAEEQFLIIHLDGVSAEDFYAHWQDGELPNLERLFADGIASHALTLFPPSTEMITGRIRSVTGSESGTPVGWYYYDREQERVVAKSSLVWELIQTMPRISRSQFFLAIPGFYSLTGLQLMNVPRLLQQYDVLEFFWYHTDFIGHLLGADSHQRSLLSFDRYMGLLLRSDLPDDLNIILYADHGMTLGKIDPVPLPEIIADTVGDKLLFFHYPNIYLCEQADPIHTAQTLGNHPDIDFAFANLNDNVVRGYHSEGFFDIRQNDGRYAYAVTGADPFGYTNNGYNGEYLSQDDWLAQTWQEHYPAAPPVMYCFLANPHSGDVVLALPAQKVSYGWQTQYGNHTSLEHTDMLVPLLLRGPTASQLGTEPVWLHEILDLPGIDLNSNPAREPTSLKLTHSSTSPAFKAAVSPAYRFRIGAAYADQWEAWMEYELHRTFLTRIWAGPLYSDQGLGWHSRFELTLGRVHLSWRYHSQSDAVLTAGIALMPNLQALYTSDGRLGLRVEF